MDFTLTAKMTNSGILGRQMSARLKSFVDQDQRARVAAAKLATQVTRNSFHYKRPAVAPGRAGRSSTGGRMRDALRWTATPGAPVEFDLAEADGRAPHWIIQEIGTGERATMHQAGQKNPQGRPTKGATYVRTVKSQVGRRISSSLAFGTGVGGAYSPPGAARGQQLFLRSQLRGAPRRGGLTISKEIEGQHFVQRGGQEGFREYRYSVIAAARRAFAGRKFQP